jgi:hypothetical protein
METPEELPPDLSPQLADEAERAVAFHRESLLASTAARTGFHEKLTVITAGSLTIVATMATNIYAKPFAEQLLNHRILVALSISAILFFLSLIVSVVHNFLETEALHLDFSMEKVGIARKIARAVFKETTVGNLDAQTVSELRKIAHFNIDMPLAAEQAAKFKKSEFLRASERWASILAVALFIAGYMPAIVFVICLARV